MIFISTRLAFTCIQFIEYIDLIKYNYMNNTLLRLGTRFGMIKYRYKNVPFLIIIL